VPDEPAMLGRLVEAVSFFNARDYLGLELGSLAVGSSPPREVAMGASTPDLFSLAGRRAFVTGASGGLGAAIAVGLAGAGADVAVHEIRREDCDATCAAIRELGCGPPRSRGTSRIRHCPAPSWRKSWPRSAASTSSSTTPGRSGAPGPRRPPTRTGTGSSTSTSERLPALPRGGAGDARGRARQDHQHRLAPLIPGRHSRPRLRGGEVGVAAITRALANEWAGRGVNVNAIAPGYMRTNNTAALRADPERSRQILERIPAGCWGEPGDLVGTASSSPPAPPTTCTGTSSSSTAAGWPDEPI